MILSTNSKIGQNKTNVIENVPNDLLEIRLYRLISKKCSTSLKVKVLKRAPGGLLKLLPHPKPECT